jgi:hypothetical protein
MRRVAFRPSGSGRPVSSFSRRRRAVAAALLLVGVAFAQDHRAPAPDPQTVPAGLRVKKVEAFRDLGALRAPPAPARRGEEVMWFGAACSHCLKQKTLVSRPGGPELPDRVLGLPRDAAAAYVERLAGKPPILIATARTSLFVASDGGDAAGATEDELARLRVFFPKLAEKPTKLDAHQFAHLYAERLVALEAALVDLLDLGDDGRKKSKPGPYAVAEAERAELFLFGDPKAAAAFDGFLGGEDGPPGLSGAYFKQRPVAGLSVHGFSPNAARRRFAYAAASVRLRSLAVGDGAAPPWLRIGAAHVLEHAADPEGRGDDVADTLPPDPFRPDAKAPADRLAFVRAFVDEGKAPHLDALSASEEAALTPKSRLAAWSLVRYLAGVDRARFAALYLRLVDGAPTPDRARSFADAVRLVYGIEVAALDNAWRVAVVGEKK